MRRAIETLSPDVNSTEGDFEYHVNKAELPFLGSLKEPAVVLFGWGGCSDKYLVKYSLIYEQKSCSTFRCIVSPRVLFPGKRNEVKLQAVAEKIVSILCCHKFDEHPLYFHCFSNAGSLVYSAVSKVIRGKSDTKFQVKGCIFDSGPAKIYASNIISAAVHATKGSVIAKYTYAVLVLTYMYAVAGCTWLSSLVHFEQPSSQRFAYYEYLANEPNICPQLFLYSRMDDVCPYESIEEFINIRRSKNVEVTAIMWESSPHVKHFVMFEKEYVESVMKFIEPHLSVVLAAKKEKELES